MKYCLYLRVNTLKLDCSRWKSGDILTTTLQSTLSVSATELGNGTTKAGRFVINSIASNSLTHLKIW